MATRYIRNSRLTSRQPRHSFHFRVNGFAVGFLVEDDGRVLFPTANVDLNILPLLVCRPLIGAVSLLVTWVLALIKLFMKVVFSGHLRLGIPSTETLTQTVWMPWNAIIPISISNCLLTSVISNHIIFR